MNTKSKRISKLITLGALCLISLLLLACGKKGDLFLPEENVQLKSVPTEKAAQEEEKEEEKKKAEQKTAE